LKRDADSGRTSAVTAATPVWQSSAATTAATGPAAQSEATSLARRVRRLWLGVGLGAIAAVLALVAAGAYYWRASALTESDFILLTDFTNTTGDAVFDGTLKQALAVKLQESPFLNVVSEQKVQESLRFMEQPAEARVTPALGREICQRQNVKAMTTGEIASLGTSYVLTLNAINCQTGDSLARVQEQAASKEEVLKALGRAATALRGDLGERLSSIEQFNAPIEEATTSSLEALKAYALGDEQRDRGREFEALPLLRRAIELDPNFAMAWARLGVAHSNFGDRKQAAEYLLKAYELRDRVSERERLYIMSHYHRNVTGEVEKAIESYELWKRTYPRDFTPRNNLAVSYSEIGQFEKALAEAQEALRLQPDSAFPYNNVAGAYMALNRFDEAKAIHEQALARNLDSMAVRETLFQIAYFRGDEAEMQRQLDALKGRPEEIAIVGFRGGVQALAGRWREAKQALLGSIDGIERMGLKSVAGDMLAGIAIDSALFGVCSDARTHAESARTKSRSANTVLTSATALALCGDLPRAQALVDEVARENPTGSVLNRVHLPEVRAVIEIRRGNPQKAIDLLESGVPFEAAHPPNTFTRAHAYLELGDGEKAAAQFQRILDNRGTGGLNTFYPLSRLGLARAKALAGDAAGARTAYQDFLAAWKDADPDLPILKEAKAEYAKLQ
jgi:tetratricopeptide (TPR) repeat protein